MEEGNIKAIDRTSVHKICSGQVVLTLAIAVKELVENSIDAGATIIDIKLKEYGSELIEVIDNGKGVKASDFQSLTLKHHTSKIADFSDVPFVSTFGFRGEALSSLCALSDLEITTRHTDVDVGTTLKYDHNGVIVKSTPIHRQVGTTITLKNIFSTFPVRHKEFLRHLRKEYSKMLQLLTAYCLISVNKRITCSNINEKGRKTVALSTNNCQGVKENIMSIYGDKQVKQLMEIVQHLPSSEILQEYFLPDTAAEASKVFKLEGYISNSTHGEGRSACDRQFYFINGRPCDLPKVSKLINEVYHSFNKNQYPFVFMDINLGEGCADVNVTPDKRQVFIPDEKVLLALMKATILEMYGKQPSQMMASTLNFHPLNKKTDTLTSLSLPSVPPESNELSLKRKLELNDNSLDDEDPIPPSFKNQKVDLSTTKEDIVPSSSQFNSNNSSPVVLSSPSTSSSESLVMNPSPLQNGASPLKNSKLFSSNMKHKTTSNINFTLTLPMNEEKLFKKLPSQKSGSSKLSEILALARRGSKSPSKTPNPNSRKTSKQNIKDTEDRIADYFERVPNHTIIEKYQAENDEKRLDETDDVMSVDDSGIDSASVAKENDSPDTVIETSLDEAVPRQRKYKTIQFSMEMFQRKSEIKGTSNEVSEKCTYRKFRTKIDPNKNKDAEEELKKEISKDSFAQMEIIGQFNLGFIITRLIDDLFIIDQHATDEKYNFEQLQKETVLETQQLLQPQNLNLSAVSEATLLDNLRVFEMNGFNFQINEDNPSGEKVQLVSVPVSHNWRFGKEDVDELIFMLTDNTIRMVRPSRVNQMFASRACRKSIMIGTALTKSMMKKLVMHMGEIEQPWNCPHGRPTIRHLFNLNLLKSI